MPTHKISVKLYLDQGQNIAPDTWFKTFNTWISAHHGSDVLIDVADYSHVPAGPVTLLLGHQYDISIDDSDDKRGLLYNRKQPGGDHFAQQLSSAVRAACETCQRLEAEDAIDASFRGNEIRIILNDRLNAPNTQDTLNAIQNDLNTLLSKLYGGADVAVVRREDEKQRFTLDMRTEGDWPIEKLLENL
ncbi:MAG: hypothetical protein QGG64_04005 [Candidatus Latescibacteria bacterium]|jgi:hypothetical protein|nr:hypothetical protein [Candidatus Latescibacterota bacterium]